MDGINYLKEQHEAVKNELIDINSHNNSNINQIEEEIEIIIIGEVVEIKGIVTFVEIEVIIDVEVVVIVVDGMIIIGIIHGHEVLMIIIEIEILVHQQLIIVIHPNQIL